ncbi:hypothetical protein [Natrinema salinisoli]|uniref:hypothetical protein n=1 Tax=Natrinema salinisoli TaxID=2878535 RepID=UPI001CF0928A|nr:hypothetical protein [Natrinema salinisoli]
MGDTDVPEPEPETRNVTAENWQSVIEDGFIIQFGRELVEKCTEGGASVIDRWNWVEGPGQENNIILLIEVLGPSAIDVEGLVEAKKLLGSEEVDIFDFKVASRNTGYPLFDDYSNAVAHIVFRRCTNIDEFLDDREAIHEDDCWADPYAKHENFETVLPSQ